jgi:hypothetical protein
MDAQTTFSFSFTQPDLSPVAEPASLPCWPAQRLLPHERQELAVQVLAGAQPVSAVAREHDVSRKFLYQQAHTAQHALSQAFAPDPDTDPVLFRLPVTKPWLRQLVLGMVLIGHSSYRAVVDLLRDIFDWPISLGTIHNIVSSAVEPARAIVSARRNHTPHRGDARLRNYLNTAKRPEACSLFDTITTHRPIGLIPGS